MSDSFGEVYAGAYDLLYEGKDYEAECALIEDAIGEFGRSPTRDILDLGCGTGRHAVILAGRGYAVTGIDRSPAMLALAAHRAARVGATSAEFITGDIRTVQLGREFDAVIVMFAVLGYQLIDEDVDATLLAVRRHLRPGGALLFDVWYGPAVESEGPTDRVRVVHDGAVEIERVASASLDTDRHLCTVEYDLTVRGQNAAQASESHTVRYFFEAELRRFLRDADMDLVRLTAFPDVTKAVDDQTWNVLAVARAR